MRNQQTGYEIENCVQGTKTMGERQTWRFFLGPDVSQRGAMFGFACSASRSVGKESVLQYRYLVSDQDGTSGSEIEAL